MTTAAVLDPGSVTPASPREVALWSGAAMVVLAVHLMLAFGFQTMQPADRVDATEQALTVDLAPLPVTAPESVETEGLAQDTPLETIEPVEDVAEPLQQTTEATPAEEVLEPVQETQAEPETAAPVTPEEVEPAEAETQTAQSAEEPAPEPSPVQPVETQPSVEADVLEPTPPEIVDQVLPDVVAALPEPKPVAREPAPVKETPKSDPPKKAMRAKPVERPAAVAKAPAKQERAAKPNATAASKSSQKSVASKAPSVNPARWQSKVLAWINKHKRYPRGAKSRREQGVAQVNFAVDSSGTVSSVRLARSSGNAELDKAAVDMVRRASPVPAPPAGLSAGRISLALPVQFSLR